jgi:hypothetical protein
MASSIPRNRLRRSKTPDSETSRRAICQVFTDDEMSGDTTTVPIEARGETGAVLILVMIFLVVVSVLVGTLSSWAINDLNNVAAFQNNGSKLYAAGGATQVAIRSSRYTLPSCLNGSTTSCSYVCPSSATPVLINGLYIQDWCAITIDLGATTRQVVLSACLMPSSSSSLTGFDSSTGECKIYGTSTEVPVLLTATVDFDDNPPNATPATPPCTSVANESTCGLKMTIVSWVAQ